MTTVTSYPPVGRATALPDLTDRFVAQIARTWGFRDTPQLRCKVESLVLDLLPHQQADWLHRLESGCPSSSMEQEFVRRFAVHETFFHRDSEQLDVLKQDILPDLVRRKRAQRHCVLRLWSAGCSTGEEVYTLAMMVLDHLRAVGEATEMRPGLIQPLPHWRIDILGTDFARHAVEHAAGATYSDFGLSSFRELPPPYRRFFETHQDAAPGGCLLRIVGAVRAFTRFQVHNLLDPLPPIMDCDLIACRNVMIYFDEDGKRRAQAQLDRALRPGGLLLLGPTDTPMVDGYQPLSRRTSPILGKPAS